MTDDMVIAPLRGERGARGLFGDFLREYEAAAS